MVNPTSKTAKEFAYVCFAQAEAAQRAIDELDGTDLDGIEIGVFWQSASTRPGELYEVKLLAVVGHYEGLALLPIRRSVTGTGDQGMSNNSTWWKTHFMLLWRTFYLN